MVERLSLRPAEAAEAVGISRTAFYELLKADPSLPRVYIGASVRIPVELLRAWLAERSASAHR